MKTKLRGKIIKKNDQSAVMITERKVAHAIYGKQYKVSKKVRIHDPKNIARVGDQVEIEEIRPISKNIHWQIIGK